MWANRHRRLASEVNEMSEVDAAEPLQDDRFINPPHFLFGGGTMLKTVCDKKGRIRLSQAVRAKYGEKFYVVEAPGELVLLPVPRDPVKDLEELGKPLRGMSLADIKRAIQEQADKEMSG
jgi:hypothetical protein